MNCKIKLFTPNDRGFALKAQQIQGKLFEKGMPHIFGRQRLPVERPLPSVAKANDRYNNYVAKQRRSTFYRIAFSALGCSFLLLSYMIWHMRLATELFPLLLSDELVRWLALVFCLCCCVGSFFLLSCINPFREQLAQNINTSKRSLRRYAKELIADYQNQNHTQPRQPLQRLRRLIHGAEEQLSALERRCRREYRALIRNAGISSERRDELLNQLLEKSEQQAADIVAACRRQAIE